MRWKHSWTFTTLWHHRNTPRELGSTSISFSARCHFSLWHRHPHHHCIIYISNDTAIIIFQYISQWWWSHLLRRRRSIGKQRLPWRRLWPTVPSQDGTQRRWLLCHTVTRIGFGWYSHGFLSLFDATWALFHTGMHETMLRSMLVFDGIHNFWNQFVGSCVDPSCCWRRFVLSNPYLKHNIYLI
jgi:hypothetical protein